MRNEYVNKMTEDLKNPEWKDGLTCFLQDDVRGTLEFVHSMLPV